MDKPNHQRTCWKHSSLIPLLLAFSTAVASCVSGDGGPTNTVDERAAFTASREDSAGISISWGGYTEGYLSGPEESFDVFIQNESDEPLRGRYCLQLLAPDANLVVVTLAHQDFALGPGEGFSKTISVVFPNELEDAAYGLALPVRTGLGEMVDIISIQVGETEAVRRPATQADMDAALAACPPLAEDDERSRLTDLALADLADRLGVSTAVIQVSNVEATEFSDTSLGVPQPGMDYAQVITPGYILTLSADGGFYVYHGAGDFVVAVPEEQARSAAFITIQHVRVEQGDSIQVLGVSSLPDGTCLGSEVWAGGELQTWWPGDACIEVDEGVWSQQVTLGESGLPASLDENAQYMLRVFQRGGADIVAVMAFDLSGPPSAPITD